MGYLGRRIGKSQNTGTAAEGENGSLGGGIMDLFEQGYFAREGDIVRTPGAAAQHMSATGGLISDYNDGGTLYRAHIFTTTGNFVVTDLGNLPDGTSVDYLVVAGGGGGGGAPSASGGRSGGGAGGLRSSHPDMPSPKQGSAFTVSAGPTTYTITVGAGGKNGTPHSETDATRGGNSSVAGPDITTITTSGGGAGGENNPLKPGGSGAGPGGTGNTPPQNKQLGNAGGSAGGSGTSGGGGGGAGGAGSDGSNSGGGAGGVGIQIKIGLGPSSTASGVGAPGPSSSYQWFAGGGGGGGTWNAPGYRDGGAGGAGGGGAGKDGNDSPNMAVSGLTGTGGGGGAAGGNPGAIGGYGGNGGSGAVILRYRLASIDTAKATGGSVSFYNNKTIHTFSSSGLFTAPGSFDETLEYVIIGGGGAGGGRSFRGGGGGAGAVRHGTTAIDNTGPGNPSTTTVQVGAGGVYVAPEGPNGNGTSSFFGSPITSPGGGMGSGYETPYAGIPGGSGGGAGGYPSDNSGGTSSGDPFPGNPADTSPANGWGYDGGATTPGGNQQGGGGGGAGGLGIPQSKSASPTTYGYGGPGIQLPATFRDPRSAPGGTGGTGPHGPGVGGGLGYQSPGGTGWYVAGGGNGGGYSKPTGVNPSVNTFVPSGGGGRGAINGPGNAPEPEHPYRNNGWPGAVNSGSGGGGASPAYAQVPGQGGSGLVLIAYPT